MRSKTAHWALSCWLEKEGREGRGRGGVSSLHVWLWLLSPYNEACAPATSKARTDALMEYIFNYANLRRRKRSATMTSVFPDFRDPILYL